MGERKSVSDSVAAMGWDELGLVCEGLAYGQRLLRAATKPVTRQYDLGPRGAFMLSLISGGARYPLDLAQVLKCGRSLITSELARLSEAGLVLATPGVQDKRRTALTLTREGETACERVRGEMERILKRNMAAYSADEIRLFSRMLRDARHLEAAEAG